MLGLLVAAGVAVSITERRRHEEVQRTSFARPASLAMALAGGKVRIESWSGSTVEVVSTQHWSGRRPSTDARLGDDGTLRIESSCLPAFFNSLCTTDYVVRVPPRVRVSVTMAGGDLELVRLDGDIEVGIGAGQVRGVDLRSSRTSVDMFGGSVEATFATRPRDVAINAGTGSVDLVVPEGRYQLALNSATGDEQVIGVARDPSAESRIAVDVAVGSVVVTGVPRG